MKSIVERIHPTGANVLIEVEALGERKSKGGLFIPDSSSEGVREGIIVAIGKMITTFAVGDHILCSAHVGIRMDMKKDGLIDQGLWMLSAEEILAKIDAE